MTPGEHGPLNKLSIAHMSSRRSKQQAQDLQGSLLGPLCEYCGCQLGVLDGAPMRGKLFDLLLGMFSFCWVVLFIICMTAFAQSYYILLYPVWLFCLRGLLFSEEEMEERGSRGQGRSKIQGVERGESVVRMYCMREESIFIYIYIFVYYVCNILSVCLKDRRGRQTSLQMVVSHHVVAEN